MTGPFPALRDLAGRHLGPCRLVALPGGDRPGQRVARFRAADGQEYIAKQHSAAEKHRREVHAYRRWAPALAANAPQLIAADQATMTVLITALPGQPVDGAGDIWNHRQAGVLLRAFHDAEPPRPLDSFQHWLASRIAWWRGQCLPLLSAWERQVIDQHLATLHGLGAPPGGPCHLDYQPRNWVTDHAGTLRVIDFEHARIDLPARDLVRLYFRCWPPHPGLREAFLDGYGRPLTDQEDLWIRCCGAIDVLTALVRGAQNDDAAMTAHGRATLRQLSAGSLDA
jgi:hypothetical protein